MRLFRLALCLAIALTGGPASADRQAFPVANTDGKSAGAPVELVQFRGRGFSYRPTYRPPTYRPAPMRPIPKVAPRVAAPAPPRATPRIAPRSVSKTAQKAPLRAATAKAPRPMVVPPRITPHAAVTTRTSGRGAAATRGSARPTGVRTAAIPKKSLRVRSGLPLPAHAGRNIATGSKGRSPGRIAKFDGTKNTDHQRESSISVYALGRKSILVGSGVFGLDKTSHHRSGFLAGAANSGSRKSSVLKISGAKSAVARLQIRVATTARSAANDNKNLGTGGGDLARMSGMLRDAARGKGYFGVGKGTRAQAEAMGRAWVGPGYRETKTGKGVSVLVSKDGLRQYRAPSDKKGVKALTGAQANFEHRSESSGEWTNNAHLDIID